MKLKYVAIDGTTFDTEDECDFYEGGLNHEFSRYIEMYDDEGVCIHLSWWESDVPQNWQERVGYICVRQRIPSEVSAKINNLFPSCPCEKGWYRKSAKDNYFVSLEEDIMQMCKNWWYCPFIDDLEDVMLNAVKKLSESEEE